MSRIPQNELDAIVLALGSTDGVDTRTLLWQLKGFVYGDVPRAQYRREYRRLRSCMRVLGRQGIVDGNDLSEFEGVYWWSLTDTGLQRLHQLREEGRP